jgi:GH15 family glucan-1,4-alpha-glucosidase
MRAARASRSGAGREPLAERAPAPAPQDGRGARVAARIEDYALVGDTHSAALVCRDGAVDWLCWPRFDSDALFAALLGDERHGRWTLAPSVPVRRTRRRYLPDTLVLETEHETDGGAVRVTDFMPPRDVAPDLVRVVEGLRGAVPMRSTLVARFGYGERRPWIRQDGRLLTLTSAPDALAFTSDLPCSVRDDAVVAADFEVRAGDRAHAVLTWHSAHGERPRPIDADAARDDTVEWWRAWSASCRADAPWSALVERSRITLKALTYAPTGGIVAAPTTSLPERIGGVRNWDYRYCWLRDATLTLTALGHAGCSDEAVAWRNWLLRAACGDPSRLQIMYGIGGERRLTELEIPWLPGYEGSRPVRIGNAAAGQLQLDVYGEVIDALHRARALGAEADGEAWQLQAALLEHLERAWRQPDEGIWEVRGPRRHFTHSKVMAWVAFDRAVKDAERLRLPGPVDRWRALRDEIHAEVLARAWDPARGTFTQSYGSRALDAALLLIPSVGFLPPGDPRVAGTVAAVERELTHDGFVLRYPTDETEDGLPPGEGAFLACSFWLADALVLLGRVDEARARFERLVALANDVGLLAEEYDPASRRLVGNFPQAFSHVALVNTAVNLSAPRGPAQTRRE